ncbi:RNA polymerase sigma-70 factor [Chitinophaga horti]|uniref:RNA polymerase sigma-70 factor n=1 Tax=Chitinophaga horti TaxID=2920382 RepID=A0ABY6J8F1_9BACT|nr:RNA polymerase sigma-70 factor [Chitinophaga horti]UYQ95877.1 RNA polymerase sigma-70 factor [Chitinophaga horti]
MSEAEMLAKIAEGSLQAFRELMVRYEARIYHFIFKLVKSQELAEEITQDVFIKLWEARETLGSIDAVGAWLHTLSKNKSLNVIKEKAARLAREEQYAGMAALEVSPEQEITLNDYQRILNDLIANLPPKRKEIFLLKTRDGLSVEEIATLLHLSPHTVKNQLGKSYGTIRQLMSELIYLMMIAPILQP